MSRTTKALLTAALLACCAAGARAQSGSVRRPPAPSPEGGAAQSQTPPAAGEGAHAAERACAEGEAAAAAGRDPEALEAFGRGLKLYLGLLDRDRPAVPASGPPSARDFAAFREAMRARMGRVPECAEGYLRLARGLPASERAQLEALRGQALMLRETDDSLTVFFGPEADERARIEAKPEPGYTEEARRNRVRGRVRVRAVLASDGTVKHVLVLKGLPHGLSEQAVAAARRTRFTPALRNGRPVSQFITLEYGFETY